MTEHSAPPSSAASADTTKVDSEPKQCWDHLREVDSKLATGMARAHYGSLSNENRLALSRSDYKIPSDESIYTHACSSLDALRKLSRFNRSLDSRTDPETILASLSTVRAIADELSASINAMASLGLDLSGEASSAINARFLDAPKRQKKTRGTQRSADGEQDGEPEAKRSSRRSATGSLTAKAEPEA